MRLSFYWLNCLPCFANKACRWFRCGWSLSLYLHVLWNNGMLRASFGVYDYYHIYFMKYDYYAIEWYTVKIHPVMLHWVALFSKLNVKVHLCHFTVGRLPSQSNVAWFNTRLSLSELRNNIILFRFDNHLHNSPSFSSCVSIHHHCLAQNGLISPWATLDTIVKSYQLTLK